MMAAYCTLHIYSLKSHLIPHSKSSHLFSASWYFALAMFLENSIRWFHEAAYNRVQRSNDSVTPNFWTARDVQTLELFEDACRGYLKSREGLDEAAPQERGGAMGEGSHRRSQSVWACRRSFHHDIDAARWVFQLKPTPASRAAALQQYPAPPLQARTLARARTHAADRPQTPSGWRWWMVCITWLLIWTLAKQLGPAPPSLHPGGLVLSQVAAFSRTGGFHTIISCCKKKRKKKNPAHARDV